LAWFVLKLGRNNSFCLVIVEQSTQTRLYCETLKEKTAKGVVRGVRRVFAKEVANKIPNFDSRLDITN
jgi:hypothetical protein